MFDIKEKKLPEIMVYFIAFLTIFMGLHYTNKKLDETTRNRIRLAYRKNSEIVDKATIELNSALDSKHKLTEKELKTIKKLSEILLINPVDLVYNYGKYYKDLVDFIMENEFINKKYTKELENLLLDYSRMNSKLRFLSLEEIIKLKQLKTKYNLLELNLTRKYILKKFGPVIKGELDRLNKINLNKLKERNTKVKSVINSKKKNILNKKHLR